MTEDEKVGQHHGLNGYEFEQAWKIVKDTEVWCYSLWGRKESDMTQRLNNNSHLGPIVRFAGFGTKWKCWERQ